jgi:DNA-binding NarL/FixJ family response regulator
VDKSPIRVLVVDDSEPWRRYFSNTLGKQPGLQVIGEVSDGLEAVQRAEELQPDLILLDIGLPTLNGIEAARRIREVSPASKILFVSEDSDWDIAKEALSTGAGGYVVKSDAASELLPAVEAVLKGKRFVSASLAADRLHRPPDPQTGARFHRDNVVTLIPTQNVGSTRHHEVQFYSDDAILLDGLTRFIGAALNAGNSAIVLATEAHRDSLLRRLQAHGINLSAASEQGSYLALDAAEALSTFMVNDMIDPVLFLEGFSNLILKAATAATGEHPRVAIFGECVRLLCEQGEVEAAIQFEKLGNQLVTMYDVDILCAYSLDSFQGETDNHMFQRICAEHSAVHSQ